ncbi:acetolactate synthase small subunit [Curtanaerobium respiraculi]|uniref:acetolactate synthase small subunit n=1 Tax=Curtanaerobium respiraculi TaxID=2949669 RepID=UPI0024B36FEE|nr:acetolactate synthase small subunit [Curtanaerobium respiraculi]
MGSFQKTNIHIISVLVENKAGVLSRVTGLISRRGFNIESLAVGPTEDPDISRMTIVVDADDAAFEQITKQLNKLVSVYKITRQTSGVDIVRELMLVKVSVLPEVRSQVIEIADIFRAKIIDVGKDSVTIEATGDENKLAGLENLLRPYGIREIIRTGKIAMPRSGAF